MQERIGDWISTYTGRKFWVLDPRPEEINIEDIAHALSMMCRYRGHCKFFYSVAQHCIGVQETLKEWGYNELIQLYGLLHDATEAYICDIPRPIKNNIPNYKSMENELEVKILQAFNLSRPIPEISKIIKDADNAMLKCEAKVLMSDWEEWYLPYKKINIIIEEKPIHTVKKEFLKLASKLLK